MNLSQKITKWLLFGIFLLFMPSIYYMVASLMLFTPIHMARFMIEDTSLFFIGLINLVVYLPVYYGLSVFLARFLFKISHVLTKNSVIIFFLSSIALLGIFTDYGELKNRWNPQHHFSWIQSLQYFEGRIDIKVSPSKNFAPGQVSLWVDTWSQKHEKTNIAWDLDEDGETEIEGPHENQVEYTYAQPGLYHPRVVVTDREGQTFEATIEVPILDRVELESRLNAQWSDLWSILTNGDQAQLKQITTDKFRKTVIAGFIGSSYLTENWSSRYSAPLSIVENYKDSSRWVIILHSKRESPTTKHQTPVEVGFEYDSNPYTVEGLKHFRIFSYRELPEDYTLESHLSSKWLDVVHFLEQGEIEEATKFIAPHTQKLFQKFWFSEGTNVLGQANLLHFPLTLVKNETGKLTLQSADPREEPFPLKKIKVDFIRGYNGAREILNFEVLENNENLESELNTQWMALWDTLAQRQISKANTYIRYSERSNEFFYFSHKDKQYLPPLQWITQTVDWTDLARQFRFSLKLINRCDGKISLVHIFPTKPENPDFNYLEVNFEKNSFGPWQVDQIHLYSRPLPSAFATSIQENNKGKNFDMCLKSKDLGNKERQTISNRIRRLLEFR